MARASQVGVTTRRAGLPVLRASSVHLGLFAIAFIVAYRFGMSFSQTIAAPFWLPDSVLLCALLISPPDFWWRFVLASLPIRILLFVPPGTPPWFLAACFVNDSLKALFSAWLLRRISRPAIWLDRLGAFTHYFLIAVVLSPFLSAVAGAASRVYLGDNFVGAFRSWFLGNALASLVLTPLLVSLVSSPHGFWGRYTPRRFAVAFCILAGLAVGGHLAFHRDPSGDGYTPFLLYVPVPFLLCAAVIEGPIGASLSLLIISLLAIFETIAGRSPFLQESPTTSLISIQLFVFFLSLPFMFLSVLIAQQRRTESSLRESDQRFRSLVDAMPVMVWMSDAEAQCTFFNNTWLAFTGGHPEQDLGSAWADSIHAEDRESCIRHYLSAFHSRDSFVLEHRLLRHDGVYRWVLDHGFPRFGADGQFLGYIGSCIDITDRKEAEDRLHQLSNQVMNSAEAERARIGQELHDDLAQRAAMFSLRLSQLARTPGKSAPKQDLQELQERATDLCRDIANISHRLRPVLLEKLGLVVALQDLCRQSTSDGQTITWSGDEELPNLSNEVSLALYRIAQEALRNATTHSGASRIYVELKGSQAAVTLTVTDKGHGFNVLSTGLSGLGLSGMAERMRNVGGHLEILSSPGNGTTVTATAPTIKAERAHN